MESDSTKSCNYKYELVLAKHVLLSASHQGIPGPGQYHIKHQFEKPADSCGSLRRFTRPFLAQSEVCKQNQTEFRGRSFGAFSDVLYRAVSFSLKLKADFGCQLVADFLSSVFDAEQELKSVFLRVSPHLSDDREVIIPFIVIMMSLGVCLFEESASFLHSQPREFGFPIKPFQHLQLRWFNADQD